MMNFQLLNIIRIFDFFASFVRSLMEIVKDAAQIGSMLLFIVTTLSFLFYILDLNSKEPAYSGEDRDTLFKIMSGWSLVII